MMYKMTENIYRNKNYGSSYNGTGSKGGNRFDGKSGAGERTYSTLPRNAKRTPGRYYSNPGYPGNVAANYINNQQSYHLYQSFCMPGSNGGGGRPSNNYNFAGQKNNFNNTNYSNNGNGGNNRRRGSSSSNMAAAGATKKNEPKSPQCSTAVLNVDQVKRLYEVMQEPLEVHGRGNFPTLYICLRRFIRCVMRRLDTHNIKVTGVKMNGGAASYVLATKVLPFNDIDLIFEVDLSSTQNLLACDTDPNNPMGSVAAKFDIIKHSVFDSLIDFLPADVNRAKMTVGSMKTAYVRKLVKVCEREKSVSAPATPTVDEKSTPPTPTNQKKSGDLWSLISLNNDFGRFVELKFVERMRRQFEFSVDSFQIDLDPIVKRDRLRSEDIVQTTTSSDHHQQPQQDDVTVKIQAESVFGDYNTALRHLNHMLIDTVNPELIRGGGLLKYVNLLVRGYRPAPSSREVSRMERYMCSRFFIDFNSYDQQQHKLRTYMDNHFQNDLAAKFDYLLTLHRVVDESTVCLMNHELRMSLGAIEQMAFEVNMEMCYEQQLAAAHHAMANVSVANESQGDGGDQAQQKNPCQRCRRPSSVASTITSATTIVPSDAPGSLPVLEAPPPSEMGSSGGCNCSAPKSNTGSGNEEGKARVMKPTLLFVPRNASYWIPVM